MKKKAAGKSKDKASKPAKRNGSSKAKKPVDLVEVRKDITNIVGSEATQLARAVVEEGRKGQLAPVKYLFEVAGLYPVAEGNLAKPEGESLAKTLLDRLGLPTDPVIRQEEEVSVKQSLPGGKSENKRANEDESENCISQHDRRENQVGAKNADGDDDVTVSAESIP